MFIRRILILAIFLSPLAALPLRAEGECNTLTGVCFGVDWTQAKPADVAKVKSDAKNRSGSTPLHWAAIFNGNPEVINALLKAGIYASAKNQYGNTPLHGAANFNENTSVMAALLNGGADVLARDDNSATPLHYAAKFNPNPEIPALLMRAGADVNARDQDGNTPLHMAAAFNENTEVIITLLPEFTNRSSSYDNYNRNRNRNADWGDIAGKNSDTVKAIVGLLEFGLSASERNRSQNRNRATPQQRQKRADVNARNREGETPLHMAARHGATLGPVLALLQAGANVNVRGKFGETPLHRAAVNFNDDPRAISALLQAGARHNTRDKDRETPLHWAARVGENPEIISVLLRAGAATAVKNKSGKTPFDLVKENEALKDSQAYWELHDAQFADSRPSSAGGDDKYDSAPDFNSGGSPAETAFENGWRSVVVVKTFDAQGSGVVIRPNLVATNCHVVEGGGAIYVYKADNRRAQIRTAHSARVYRGDDERDLCLLDVRGLFGTPAKIRQARTLRVGEQVFAIGAPKGFEYSLSAGIVSQLRGGYGTAPYIQTDAAISPGSSGGGLFDKTGRLVGITTFKEAGEADEGIAFAIPSEWILQMQ